MITAEQIEAIERLAKVDRSVSKTIGRIAREVGRTHPRDYPAIRDRHVAIFERLGRENAAKQKAMRLCCRAGHFSASDVKAVTDVLLLD